VFAVPLIMTGGGLRMRRGSCRSSFTRRLRVLQDGALRQHERFSFAARDDLYDLPDTAVFARGGMMMRGHPVSQHPGDLPLLFLICSSVIAPLLDGYPVVQTNDTMFSCLSGGSRIPINWNAYGERWKAQDSHAIS